MSKCALDIKLDIVDLAREQALNLEGFREALGQKDMLEITDSKQAAASAKKVNDTFKEDVITPSVTSRNHYFISPSDKLTEIYFGKYKDVLLADATDLQEEEKRRGGYTEDEKGEFFQSEEAPTSKASPATMKIVKDFLTRIGVKYQALEAIVVNGVKQDANGVALIMQKLVQVVEGKEDTVLPEEAMHFAVEIIAQNDPALFRKLMNEVNDYQLMKDVFATYSSDPNYQIDGKPNVIKLKKEAIAKILVETLINKNEGLNDRPELLAKAESWWARIINAIKGIFSKSGFDAASMKILSGEVIGTADDIRAQEQEMYLQINTQDSIYNKLKETHSSIDKRPDGLYINDKKIPSKVSDIVKDWYSRRFKGLELTKSEYDKAVDDLKAQEGMAGHADFQAAFELFVNKDGILRTHYLDDNGYKSRMDPNDNAAYEILRDNLQARLESYPNGTKFLSKTIVYDAKRGIADSIDFIAITPTGKVNMLDWKFMEVNIEKTKGDVPWFKVRAFQQEMDQFKTIIQNAYGVDPKNVEQARTIPIRIKYIEGNAKTGVLPRLDEVEIGDVNVKNVTQGYLLPVGVESESTGNKKIDNLVEKLNAVYKRISETKVLPSEKLSKAEQLNELFTAIRQLQMKQNIHPLIRQAKLLNNQIQNVIDKYNNDFKGKDATQFTDEQINAFAADMITAENTIHAYTTLDTDLKFLFTGMLSAEDKALREELRDTVDDARDLQSSLREVSDEFTNDIIAGSEGVENLLSPEKIIKGVSKFFASTATLQIKALEVLYKKANKVFAFANMDTLSETKKLQGLKSEYDKLAASKGLNAKNQFDLIKKKDSNHLVDEFEAGFYSELQTNIANKEVGWIKDNVDVAAFAQHMRTKLGEELDRIADKDNNRIGTAEQNKEDRDREISLANKLFDVSTMGSPGWFLYDEVKLFPKRDKWESAEWKELNKTENKAALDFYKYIIERNTFYQSIGYLSGGEARSFLPYVRKGLIEKLIFGGNISLGEQFMRGISIDEGDTGFGQIDPLTGRPIDTVPIYFTKEIDGDVSTDLFRTMALYNEMAIKYKYVTDINPQKLSIMWKEGDWWEGEREVLQIST